MPKTGSGLRVLHAALATNTFTLADLLTWPPSLLFCLPNYFLREDARMIETALIPYVACEYFEPGARRFSIGLHGFDDGFRCIHGLRIRCIRDIAFEETGDGQRVTFDHVHGLFVLHGRHLHHAVAERTDDIRDLYVFDPARHLPAGKDAPIIYHLEVPEFRPGRTRFQVPRHVLYEH
jgi:hypothetical protein